MPGRCSFGRLLILSLPTDDFPSAVHPKEIESTGPWAVLTVTPRRTNFLDQVFLL